MNARLGTCLTLGALAALTLIPAAALGQATGTLIGNVYDQSGTPVAGVRVRAKSDTQIGGTKTAYTGHDGAFRFSGLEPGVFEVAANAPKMKQVLQKDVRVGITAPAEVNIILEVETAVEEVRVVQSAPTISTTAANMKETYDLDYIASLPLDNLLTKVEPFVRLNTPGAGSDGDRYRGGTSRQNLFMVEGFTMVSQRYTMASLSTIEAQTGAYGAENSAVQGAVVGMVTKSGSNKLEMDAMTYYEDTALSPFADSRTTRLARTGFNPSLSAPIVKDKLWFYVSLEGRQEVTRYPPDPAPTGLLPDKLPTQQTLLGRGSFKLTWQVSPRHKLQSFTLYNREIYDSLTDGDYSREPDAAYRSPRMSFFTGVIWEALLTDNIFLRTQAGVQGDGLQNIPQNCTTDPDCLNIAPIEQTYPRPLKLKNYEAVSYDNNRAFEVVNTIEWFPRTTRFGDHDVKLTSRYYTRQETNYSGVPGDTKTTFDVLVPNRQATYYSNDPRLASEPHFGYFIRDASGSLFVNSLTDSVRANRYLSFNPGLAFTVVSSNTSAGKGSLNLTAVTPHLSAVWDATHDGRTALRASFANYVDADAVRVSRYALGDQVSRTCRWDETSQTFNRDCQFAGGPNSVTFGLPCGAQGVDASGNGCRRQLQLPRMWEYTLGAERELIPGVSVGGDFVYRLYTHPFELTETNRVWTGSGGNLNRTGAYRNGRAEVVQDLETPDNAQRRYIGMTGVVRKRAGRFKVQMGYTWSKLEGNVDNASGDNNLFGDIGPRDVYLWGYLRDDHRHDVRGTASWQATDWLSVGTTYSYASGATYSRTYRNDITGKSEDYRSAVGKDVGGNINDPADDRELRLPDIQRLNIKVAVNLRPFLGVNLESFVDFLNVLNLRTITAVTTEDGPAFGQPRTLMNPMLLRVGARFRY